MSVEEKAKTPCIFHQMLVFMEVHANIVM
jgi:hypothetical protein